MINFGSIWESAQVGDLYGKAMKTRDVVTLGSRLIPDLPGFIVKERLLLMAPLHHTVRGIYFDDSSFDQNLFFVEVFLWSFALS